MPDGHINQCKACRNSYVKSWQERNGDKRREIGRKSAARNYSAARRSEAFAKWYQSTKAKDGHAKMYDRVAKRRLMEQRATPAWAEQFFIEEAYRLAQLRSKVTGFEWHVDHIVPIKSDLVCGLHTHENMQVIPAALNKSKRNFYWPDMAGKES